MRFLFLFLSLSFFVGCKQETQTESTQNKVSESKHTFPLMPKTLSFAGETMPLERLEVYESLEYEMIKNVNWHSNILILNQRMGRYFPVIEKILEQEGVPLDFKYLAVAESGLDAKIESPAKAKGFWQFLKETGREYGLEINSSVDERSHIEKSTRAACQFLKELKQKTGSWTLAAAAYNTGLGNLQKFMKEQNFDSNQNTYYDLVLYDETQRYIYRILALKTILESPESYGFSIPEERKFKPFETQKVKLSTPYLNDFVKQHTVSQRAIRFYNPWVIGDTFSSSDYELEIPMN